MRTLAFLLILALPGCATVERPKSLSAAEVVALAKEGRNSQQIIAELQRTRTVLPLQASDIVRLHESGVPGEVLDYLQRVQIDDIRWRERSMYWYGPGFGPGFGWGPCPWPYRGRWGC